MYDEEFYYADDHYDGDRANFQDDVPEEDDFDIYEIDLETGSVITDDLFFDESMEPDYDDDSDEGCYDYGS